MLYCVYMYACMNYTCIQFTHMSAFHGTVSQLDLLHIASYLFFITTEKIGRDDIRKIDARVENKFNWYWFPSEDVEWHCPLTPLAGGCATPKPPAKLQGVEVDTHWHP